MMKRSKDRVRWHLKITKKVQANGRWADYIISQRDVHPIYDKASHSLKKASGEAYFENTLDVDLTFVNEDYEYIVGTGLNLRPLNLKYILELYYDGNLMKSTYFRKSTCKIDENHKMVEVSLNSIGIYDKIEDKKNDEINVAKLDLEKHNVWHRIRPTMQVYRAGKENYFTNNSEYILNSSKCSDITDINQLHTTDNMSMVVVFTARLYNESKTTLKGTYYGKRNISFLGGTERYIFYKNNIYGGDNIEIAWDGSESWTMYKAGYLALSRSLTQLMGTHSIHWIRSASDPDNYDILEYDFQVFGYNMLYATSSSTRYSNDFFESMMYSDAVNNVSLDPIKLELSTADVPEKYYPVYEEEWFDGFSIYVNTNAMADKSYSSSKSYYEQYTYWNNVRDYVLLQDLIKAMIAKVDSDVLFENDESHSKFFCSATNPITNEANGKYYVTAKSNVLSINYDYASWKAMLTFDQLSQMLRNVFNCYYDIYEDANGARHLRIEHMLWYLNGGSYTEATRNQIDLIANKDARCLLPLAYRTNRWEYDTSNMPTKIEFSWMDDASEAFGGVPIEVPENRMLINTNYTEKKDITAFSADLGYISVSEDSISRDGFVIIHCDDNDNVDFGTVVLDEVSYTAENYKLSMVWLHDKFWKYGICGTHAMINNKEIVIDNPPKMRTAEIEFILPEGANYDQYSVIKTEAGYGYVEEINLDLSSGKVTATVKYNLETTRTADQIVISNDLGDVTADALIDFINQTPNATTSTIVNRFGDGTSDALAQMEESGILKKKTDGTWVSIDVVTKETVIVDIKEDATAENVYEYIQDHQFSTMEDLDKAYNGAEPVVVSLMDEGSVFETESKEYIAPDTGEAALYELHELGTETMQHEEFVDAIGEVQFTYFCIVGGICKDDPYGYFVTFSDEYEREDVTNSISEGFNTNELLIDKYGKESIVNYCKYLVVEGVIKDVDGEYVVI